MSARSEHECKVVIVSLCADKIRLRLQSRDGKEAPHQRAKSFFLLRPNGARGEARAAQRELAKERVDGMARRGGVISPSRGVIATCPGVIFTTFFDAGGIFPTFQL